MTAATTGYRLPKRHLVPLAAALLAAGPAAADTSNFRPYLVGARAAGMGGAFTALADDGAGPWYNPAGIGFVEKSQVSMTGSAYGLASGSFKDALGDGRTFRYSSFDTFPTSTTAVWRLADPAPGEAQVVSVGVYLPDGYSADDRDRLDSAQNAFFFTSKQQTLWFNATWARRVQRLSFGVALYGLLRTELDATDLSVVAPGDPTQFVTLTQQVDSTSSGGVAAVGVRWDPAPGLHLGLAATSPALGTGSRRVFARAVAAPGTSAPGTPALVSVINQGGLHASPSEPGRLQGGAAWTSGPLTLSADLIWRLPRTVVDDGGRAAEGFSRTVKQLGTLDASAGLKTEHSATSVGLNVSYGRGTDLVPDNLDFSRPKATIATQRLLYVFLATTYQF